ncbi:SGNH/GDSL hydrolase family protein [Streptomyces kronopolitis]|uniref:SGNH/GDSL hydrolase family protein n=1 Tax=Streptomyces kronopolitis TaxID=1612435 RepID=UPI003697B203
MTTPLTGGFRWFGGDMHTENRPQRTSPRHRRPAALAALALVTVSAGAALAGCGGSGGGTAENASGQQKTGKKVLWIGDSIAGAEAPPLGAALTASGQHFKDASSDGGGTVVEGDKMSRPLAQDAWKTLKKNLASFHPDVIAYQLTSYDWGTPAQQRASYEKLAKTARDAGAELDLVSAPPFRIDSFYKKYEGAIKSAPKAAEQVADASGGKVHFVDTTPLWGTEPTGKQARRSPDGIHSCQQGSAAFAKWYTERLGKQNGFTPAAPQKWAQGSWTGDKRYANLKCD